MLLVSSVLFYASFRVPYLLLVLAVVWIVSWRSGIAISRSENIEGKRIRFWGAVACNLATLILCKSLPSLKYLYADGSFPMPAIFGFDFITIGISYYTIQAISYLADVYLEIQEPELHPGYFALYLCFFPKLLQGPIEKASELIPQLRAPYNFNYENVRFGLVLLAWGLFKKVVVADRMASFVNVVYGNVSDYWGIHFIIATWLYSVQIYCDFSGYTDMALGAAILFNIKLTQNFAHPYSARSITEFWRCWHISLSRWLMDYLFKPINMGMRSHTWIGTPLSLMLTFLICGIWHGSTLGFIVWGALHGFYMIVAYLFTKTRIKLPANRLFVAIKVFVTFNLVSFAWIFFRAKTFHDALYIVKNLPTNLSNDFSAFLQYGFHKNLRLGGELVDRLHIHVIVLVAFALLSAVMYNIPRLMANRYRWIVYLILVTFIGVFKAETCGFIYSGF